MDKAELIPRAKNETSPALVEIYARYQPTIYRYCFYLVEDVALAEKLTSDVFVRLAESVHRIPCDSDRLLLWLYNVAHDLASDLNQYVDRSPPKQTNAPAQVSSANAQSVAGQWLNPQYLATTMGCLSADQRQVILLKFVEGLDNKTVAQALDKPTGAIQSLQQQALATLTAAIGEDDATNRPQDVKRAQEQLQGDFVQNVAHGLRTPLTLIQSYGDLLRSGTLGSLQPEQQEALEVIHKRTGELSRVIRDLTSTRDIPEDSLDVTSITVSEWVEIVVNQHRSAAEQTAIEFEIDLAEDLPSILGDQKRLNVALSQILENAIKFSPDGGQVRLWAWTDELYLYLAVQDQGIGIAPEHLERIFDRFYQVDSSTTRRFDGMGVGLTIVRAIATAHGGRVWATSGGLGRGSTIVLALPIDGAEIPLSHPPVLAHPSMAEPGLSQALDEILLATEEGWATLEECLADYAQYADQLCPLIETAIKLRRAPQLTSNQCAYAAGQRRMLEALARSEHYPATYPIPSSRLADWISAISRKWARPAGSGSALILQPALRPVLALFLFMFCGLLLVTWLRGTTAQTATLAQVSGEVQVLPFGNDEWSPSSTGDRIIAGDRVRTSPSSTARLIFFDGSTTDMTANTEVTIAQMRSRRDGSGKVIVIQQWLGLVYNRVNPLKDQASSFRVETPTTVAAVRGTAFTVATAADGGTHVTVMEGVVNVTYRDTTVTLSSGQELSVRPDQDYLATCPVCEVTSTPWTTSPLLHPAQETPYSTQMFEATEIAALPRVLTPTATLVATEPLGLTATPRLTVTPTARPKSIRRPPNSKPTAQPTTTPTPVPMPTRTKTPKPTTMPTPVPTATPRATPAATLIPTPTASPTFIPRPTSTPTPTKTHTPEPTSTHTPEPTKTNTPEPTKTHTPEPTKTHTPEPTKTHTPEPTSTHTPEPAATPTPVPTADQVLNPDASGQPTPVATYTPSTLARGCLAATTTFKLRGRKPCPGNNRYL